MKTTKEIAEGLRIKPQTLHAAFCRAGHYFGVVPIKSPGRRLLWPDDTLDRLMGRYTVNLAQETEHAPA